MSTETTNIEIERINHPKIVLAEKNRKGKGWLSNWVKPKRQYLAGAPILLSLHLKCS